MFCDNDLTIIKGIGPARQRWLQTSFGVRTFHALAQLSIDEIALRLKTDRQIAPRQAIEAWITQAKALAVVNEAEGLTAVALITPPAEIPAYAGNGWHPVASFVVEIQSRDQGETALRTVAQHIETDRNAVWPGIEQEQLCAWLVDQVVPDNPLPLPEPLPAPITPSGELVIHQVQVFQPAAATVPLMTGYDGRPLPGLIKSSQTFALVAIVTLDVVSAPPAFTGQAHFRVRDLVTGQPLSLGNCSLEQQTATTYTAQLPCATLPPGLYHLYILAQIHGSAPSCLELPFVQVVND